MVCINKTHVVLHVHKSAFACDACPFFSCCNPHSALLMRVTGTVSSKWDAQSWRCGTGGTI